MIGRLKGTLIESDYTSCLIDVHGVGYAVNIPISTFEKLPRVNEEATLWIHTQVREDAITLFGFAEKDERKLFENLLDVSGIGGKLALAILSGMPLGSLCNAIINGDIKLLSKISGVGKRTAERLVVDLRDKLPKLNLSFAPAAAVNAIANDDPRKDAVADALMALSQLGFKNDMAKETVNRIVSELPAEDCSPENILRLAIQQLAGSR
jgi:Holliday junction DNA helicase RuvA